MSTDTDSPVQPVTSPKPDLAHSAIESVGRFISYHRYTVIGLVLALMALYFVGCEATSKSPVSGKSLGAEAMLVERNVEIARLKWEATSFSAKSQLAIQQVQSEATAKLAAIAAANDAKTQEAAAAQKALEDGYALAGADIEKKNALMQKAWDLVQTTNVANTIPGGAIALGLFGSVFGLGAGLDNRRKNAIIADLKGAPKPELV